LELADRLRATVLGDAEKEDAVDDSLDGEVERRFVKRFVPPGEADGYRLAPLFDLAKNTSSNGKAPRPFFDSP
jgi:hypothetical protein